LAQWLAISAAANPFRQTATSSIKPLNGSARPVVLPM
jgi:hypothetical protein